MGLPDTNLAQPAAGVTRQAALCVVILLTACDLAPPQTGYEPSPAARAAGYPDLLPRPAVVAALDADPVDADVTGAALAARAARLRGRVSALSVPVMSDEERARLLAAAEAAALR